MKSVSVISIVAFFTLITVRKSDEANILFYFGIGTLSHRIAVWPLVEALAENGHNVTFFTTQITHPINSNPNVTYFLAGNVRKQTHDVVAETVIELRNAGKSSKIWNSVPDYAMRICEITLNDPDVQEFIRTSNFDLVVLGSFFNECGLGMAYKFKAKYIIFSPTTTLMWFPDLFGNVPETSWIANTDMTVPNGKMSFMQRVSNTLHALSWNFWVKLYYLPSVGKIVRRNLDLPNMPSLEELWRETSLVLLNTHPSFELARSLPPLYVPVGGIHIRPYDYTLPEDIRNFVESDDSDGFIYFSFGSIAQSSTFPPELLEVFYDAFRSFQTTRFIWVFDADRPNDMPYNVLTVKWAPQHAILAHKKIKAFITQGGAMSTMESIHFSIPTILLPLFGDQDNNADNLSRRGCGIKLEIRDLSTEILRRAISKILTDNSFKRNVTDVSIKFKDRPETPLRTAIWWTEFVLRNNDTSFLKPLSVNQTWYEIRLLDVWLFLFSLFLAVVLLIVCITLKCMFRGRNNTLKKFKMI